MTFSSPVATAEFSKFGGILSAALSQHHLLRFEIGTNWLKFAIGKTVSVCMLLVIMHELENSIEYIELANKFVQGFP